MSPKQSVLVVDDERDIRELLQDLLSYKFTVFSAASGSEAMRIAKRTRPDAIILDALMPKIDGIATCELLRNVPETKETPIIMLTALSNPSDRIRAFNSGVDDFISKPFHPGEFLARVESKLRRFSKADRGKEPATGDIISCGNLKMNPQSREVEINGRMVDLTSLEFDLLRFLVERKGKLQTRADIVKHLWKTTPDVPDRLLNPHFVSLRKKIRGFDHEIKTTWGVGYLLRPKRR